MTLSSELPSPRNPFNVNYRIVLSTVTTIDTELDRCADGRDSLTSPVSTPTLVANQKSKHIDAEISAINIIV